MSLSHIVRFICTAACLLTCSNSAVAAQFVMSPINLPFANVANSAAFDINDAGQYVGRFASDGGPTYGYFFDGNNYSVLDSGQASTTPLGMNNVGQIVGEAGPLGFVLQNGTYSFLAFPGANGGTHASKINDAGQIVGWYGNAGVDHGFIYDNGTYTTVDFPGGGNTFLNGINNSGQMVGRYGSSHGFLYDGQVFTPYDVPGSTDTELADINDSGTVVGSYANGGGWTGFILSNSTITTFQYPGSTQTNLLGVNSVGEAAGLFGAGGTGLQNGLLITVPEPDTLVLFVIAFCVLGISVFPGLRPPLENRDQPN